MNRKTQFARQIAHALKACAVVDRVEFAGARITEPDGNERVLSGRESDARREFDEAVLRAMEPR